tara:strand:+ start:281 stop:532 length:252 start_codon:yes stop_codon:yes gene_type:complete
MKLPPYEISRIIEMAWEDRTPFEAIKNTYNLKEKDVISLMKKNLKRGSFILWRKRVRGRKTKLKLKNNLNYLRHQSKNHNKYR